MEEMGDNLGLARKISALGKLTKLESAIQTAIESSKVPPKETSKLLKSQNPHQVKNTAVFQFMVNLFEEIGLGRLNIEEKDNFSMLLSNQEGPVLDIYSDLEDKKTCYIVSDALTDFFTEDLNIPAEVVETECVNAGDPQCLFKVNLQPLAVYRIALDKIDEKILEMIREGEKDIGTINSELDLSEDEIEYRIDILKSYHVLRDDFTLTKIGQTYYKYGKSVIEEESKDFDPPWKSMSEISSKIADSASFAEAISSSVEEDVGREEMVKGSEVVNLAEEADKSKSFAQLVSKTVNQGESEDDEENK